METEKENKQVIYVVSFGRAYDSKEIEGHTWFTKREDAIVYLFKRIAERGFDGLDFRFFELHLPSWLTMSDIDRFLIVYEDTLVAPVDPRKDPRCDLEDALIEFALAEGHCRDGGEHEPGKNPIVRDCGDGGFTITVGCKKCNNRESSVFVDLEMFEEWED